MTEFTKEEAFLHSLAKKSFLKFWSWPNLFRNQGNGANGGDGKELCDLVVIFGNDILLFSDKKIEFNVKKDIAVSWTRWSRSAIKESVNQVRGARRWIQTFPDRIYLDKACKKKLPLDLPPAEKSRFHSIVVCHGLENHLAKFNGEPSFIFDNSIVDEDHWDADRPKPFIIGKITNCGFVHVFNEATIALVLKEFDTIKDFISYLDQRKSLIDLPKPVKISSESDIVHLYYENLDDNLKRSILSAKELRFDVVDIKKGGIYKLYNNAEFIAKKEADRISYFWDELIESFSFHVLNEQANLLTGKTTNEIEQGLRVAASTGRFERRTLSQFFIDFYNKALPGQRGTRLAFDPFDSKKAYLFLLMPYDSVDGTFDDYRIVRRGMLQDYCFINKLLKPQVNIILGIAAQTRKDNTALSRGFFQEGQDFVLFDGSDWDEKTFAYAKELHEEYIQHGLFAERKLSMENLLEFPEVSSGEAISRKKINLKGSDRNKPCICGSGKKLKKCCGNS